MEIKINCSNKLCLSTGASSVTNLNSVTNVTMLSATSLLHNSMIFNRNNTVATQQGLKTYWLWLVLFYFFNFWRLMKMIWGIFRKKFIKHFYTFHKFSINLFLSLSLFSGELMFFRIIFFFRLKNELTKSFISLNNMSSPLYNTFRSSHINYRSSQSSSACKKCNWL